jgi:hypothetical protein
MPVPITLFEDVRGSGRARAYERKKSSARKQPDTEVLHRLVRTRTLDLEALVFAGSAVFQTSTTGISRAVVSIKTAEVMAADSALKKIVVVLKASMMMKGRLGRVQAPMASCIKVAVK